MNQFLRRAQQGIEVADAPVDDVIHSMYDPRYKEWEKLDNKQKALAEYQKWHRELAAAAPRTGAEFQALESKSDSLAFARRELDPSKDEEKPVLWTNPTTGKSIYKELDMTPVTNPYTVDIAPTPWSGQEGAQKQGDAFRAWVNENYPEKAKAWDLDPTGGADNKWIRSAYYELGDEYETSMKPKEEPKAREASPDVQATQGRVATKIQTRIYPDGSTKLVRVPYYDYETQEQIPLPGGQPAVYVDEEGNIIDNPDLQKAGKTLQMGGDAGLQQMPQQMPQQMGGGNPQEQIMYIIKTALLAGEEAYNVYDKLVKQLAGRVDPKMIDQMVSAAVDSINSENFPHPEQDLAGLSGFTEEQMNTEDYSGLMQAAVPTSNAMITNDILMDDYDEALMDSSNQEGVMKMGGPVSKKKFVSNVLKLAKKQMGDAGKTSAPKASIKDTLEGDRAKIGLNFRQGLKEAATIAEVKQNAEQQYDMMMAAYQQQFGGFVDGNLQKFTCGGKVKKYQTQGQVNITKRDPIVGETWDSWYTSDGSTPAFRSDKRVWNGTDWVESSSSLSDSQNQNNNQNQNQNNNQNQITERERQLLRLLRQQGYGDGAIGQTPQGMPIYPGIFDKKAAYPRRRFRDLYPFNRGIEYAGSWASSSNARDSKGNPYTGGINYGDATQTQVTRTGLFGRPKEWTTTYNVNVPPGEKLKNFKTPTFYRSGDGTLQMLDDTPNVSMGDAPVGSRGRIRRRDMENMSVEQMRDAIDAGYKMPDQGNVFDRMKWGIQRGMPDRRDKGEGNAFQRMWWKMRQGRPHKRVDEAQVGIETCPPGYFKGEDGVCRDFQGNPYFKYKNTPAGSSFNAELDNPFIGSGTNPLTGEEYMGFDETGEEYRNRGLITQADRDKQDQVKVDRKREDMFNIDPEAALQQFNAYANLGIGLLEKRADAPQEKWIMDQTNADELYGTTRKRKLGDWDQWGNFRPDEQGFRGVAQRGGQTPTEGAEIYMSDEEIQRFIDEGGELEFI
jgi:hypothetical protein